MHLLKEGLRNVLTEGLSKIITEGRLRQKAWITFHWAIFSFQTMKYNSRPR